MDKQIEQRAVTVHTVDLEIHINAARETVWERAVNDVNAWWLTASKHEVRSVSIECFPGGRFWREDGGEGMGLLIGFVSVIRPPQYIHFVSAFGLAGISLTSMTWRLFESQDGTLFQLSSQIMCELPERTITDSVKEDGEQLLASLKCYIEDGVRVR